MDMQNAPGLSRLKACSGLAALWFASFLVATLLAGSQSGQAAAGIQALCLIVFVFVHGSLAYGWRGFLTYLSFSWVVGFAYEASSIATGFPFGFYKHNATPGPRIMDVPLAVALGYAILGWFGWTLGRVIARERPTDTGGIGGFATPVIASFVLAGYDFAYDPIGSTVLDLFTYRNPSGFMGVSVKNFLGWLLTGWTFFQLFALVERRFPPNAVAKRREFWLLPCLIWFVMALQYPIMFANAPLGTVTRGNRTFVIADVYEAAVAAALFTLTFTAIVAVVRIYGASERPRIE
jgi:putative membrane protein